MLEADFVEVGGEQCHAQPFLCKDIKMYGFFVDGDIDSIQKNICDKYLNTPSGGDVNFKALSSKVLITFAYVKEGSSVDNPQSNFGFIPETSVTIWVLTASVNTLLGVPIDRVAYFVPYIFVDNSYSMAAGREIYGFPKAIGNIYIPSEAKDPALFTVDSYVIPKYTPESEAENLQVFKIKKADDGSLGELTEDWNDVAGAIKEIAKNMFEGDSIFVDGLEIAINIFDFISHGGLPVVFLKQFRSAENYQKACYQAIIQSYVEVTGFKSGGLLLGDYILDLKNYDSHPIIKDLGLKEGKQPVFFSYWVNFDFKIGNGEEIWKAQ